jgi:membrane protease YdiL (CAAX protease family)
MALNLSGLFILLPFELGFLLYHKQKEGASSLKGIIAYTKPLKSWQYLVYVLVIIVLSGIAFKVFSFTSDLLMPLFQLIPAEMQLNMGLSDEYPKSNLIITYALFLILIVIALPIVEELYFRGYLLPRMPSKLKAWTVLIHCGLFALYHTFSPGLIIVRTLGVLPLAYMVKRKENIYIGMIAHCLGNSIDFVIGLVFIFNM